MLQLYIILLNIKQKNSKILLLLPKFWPMFFIKFLKNPKIAKNNENKKIGLLNIFASFLAFQHRIKRIKIFKDLWNSSTFKALFLKSLILFIRVDVNKKSKKIRKIKFTKKKRSWGTKFGNLQIFLPINAGLHNTNIEGNFAHLEATQKKKTHLFQTSCPPPTGLKQETTVASLAPALSFPFPQPTAS